MIYAFFKYPEPISPVISYITKFIFTAEQPNISLTIYIILYIFKMTINTTIFSFQSEELLEKWSTLSMYFC